MDDKQIKKDRLRYTKNTTSSGLAIIAIVLNVLSFVSIYKSDVGNYYYTWLTGISIIYNLLFMLTVFLCSEGVKSYKMGYSVLLMAVGAIQFVRIFIIPLKASQAMVKISGEESVVMGPAQHNRILIYLISSGVICIAAGVIGVIKTWKLKTYLHEIDAE